MKYLYYSISILIITLNSCQDSYINGELKDSKNIFDRNKYFIFKNSFKSTVIQKNFCNECNYNKFELKLKLESLTEKPNISNKQYHPYYSFEKDLILYISVSENIFKKVNVSDTIIKVVNSNDLLINGNKISYLSESNREWLTKYNY